LARKQCGCKPAGIPSKMKFEAWPNWATQIGTGAIARKKKWAKRLVSVNVRTLQGPAPKVENSAA